MVRVLREDVVRRSSALDEALGNIPTNDFDVMQEARAGLQRHGLIESKLSSDPEEQVDDEDRPSIKERMRALLQR